MRARASWAPTSATLASSSARPRRGAREDDTCLRAGSTFSLVTGRALATGSSACPSDGSRIGSLWREVAGSDVGGRVYDKNGDA